MRPSCSRGARPPRSGNGASVGRVWRVCRSGSGRAASDTDSAAQQGGGGRIRGGGGYVGVVTGFEFDLHPVGPAVAAGLLVFPFGQAGDVLRRYRDAMESAPTELNVWLILRKAPPLPFLPEGCTGR